MFQRSELKREAKARLKDNLGTAIISVLIVGAISNVIVMLPYYGILSQYVDIMLSMNSLEDIMDLLLLTSGGMSTLSTILSLFVLVPISMATVRFYILIGRNKEVRISDALDGFTGGRFLQYLGSALWVAMWLLIWSIIPIILYAVGFAMIIGVAIAGFGEELILIGFAMMLVGIILLVVITIVKSYAYFISQYIIADNPQYGVTKALKDSIKIMSGHKMELFVLDLSFILWGLAVVCTCGLAAFYVTPYMSTTYAMYYDYVVKDAVSRGIVSAADFNIETESTSAVEIEIE